MKRNNSNGQLTAQINLGDFRKSGFDLSNNVLGTGKLGRIYPTRALHVMPNDTIKNDTKVAVQFEPLAVPILANMHVKQEHFYCPYNIVWKNWDKFISGGADLNYKGVVPNVTMQRIAKQIDTWLLKDEIYLHPYVPTTGRKGWQISSRVPLMQSIASLRESMASDFGFRYEITDILQEQVEAYNNFIQWIFNVPTIGDTSGSELLFVQYLGDDFSALWRKYDEEYNLINNKYVSNMEDSLREYMASPDYSGYVTLPTSLGIEFLQHMYDIFKSFIGVGSNIDYLNMNRLVFGDFLGAVCFAFGEPVADDFFISLRDLGFTETPMSILHLRANYAVWYNNYRDVLLEAKAQEPIDTDEITDDELITLLVPRQRCWAKDAFTTALDNPGTGNVAAPINISTMVGNAGSDLYSIKYINDLTGQGVDMYGDTKYAENMNNIAEIKFGDETVRIPTAFLSGQSPLTATTYGGYALSLYALDAAQRAQKWLQKALFFGNAVTDFYYMRFGVKNLDARLHKPELLTSSTEMVRLDVVMNNTNITTEVGGEVFQSVAGDRAAYASAYDNGNFYERFCEEHGVILSYLTVMPEATYAYGQSRDYSRIDQFDFAFTEFATLGMDAVYDTEITAATFFRKPKVFGYQGRYYDYKAKHSEEHGELLDSQDMYSFGRRFEMLSDNGGPKLNYAFVHCFPPLDMFVVDSKLADYFRFDMRHNTAAERLLPVQSIYI